MHVWNSIKTWNPKWPQRLLGPVASFCSSFHESVKHVWSSIERNGAKMWPRAPESFMENSLHMEKSCISQYSIISPLESPQDSPEALLEGLQSLKVGPILVIFLLTKQIRNLHMYVSTCLNIGRWWRDDGCACFCFPSARHRMLRYVSWPEAVRIVGFTELVEGLQSCNCQLTDASQEPHRTPHRSLTGASQELLSICSMYYVWVRSCMCGDPSRATKH